MPSTKRSSASSESRVLRSGNLQIKKNGVLSWSWKLRSVTLTDKALVTPNFKIPLDRITKLERVDVKPYCLLLETVERRYLLSFESDSDLYDWQEDVYSRCPLIGAGNPFGFQHNAHMGFDDKTGSFKSTGVPTQWTQQLGIQTQNTTEKENQKPSTQLKTHHRRDSSQGGTTTLHDSTPSLPYKSTMKTIPIAEKVVEPTTLDGEYSVRVQGRVVGWRWKAKWLTLGPKTLKISKSKNAKSALTLNLRDITSIDRADLGPHCLMLEIKSSKQYHLSFKSDDELFSWQDTLYARSPLAGISSPSDFVHKVHIGYDTNSGQFTGVPAGWKAIIDGTDRGAPAPVTSR